MLLVVMALFAVVQDGITTYDPLEMVGAESILAWKRPNGAECPPSVAPERLEACNASSIIPQPSSVVLEPVAPFAWETHTKVQFSADLAHDSESNKVTEQLGLLAQLLTEKVAALHRISDPVPNTAGDSVVSLRLVAPLEDDSDASYALELSAGNATATASSIAGLHHAASTLYQIAALNPFAGRIQDTPRFKHRVNALHCCVSSRGASSWMGRV